jgi:SAM-dependent methyltransferase
LAADPALAGRVELHPGYVPADRIAPLLAGTDLLALTYRSATASQNVLLAARHGVPVLATAVGTFSEQGRDGVDGLLVPAGDRPALVAALRRLADPRYAARLRSAVRRPDLAGPWAHYVGGLEALAAEAPATAEPPARPAVDVGSATSPSGGAGRLVAALPAPAAAALAGPVAAVGRAVRARRAPRTLRLVPADIPEEVRPCDLLAVDEEAVAAARLARELGLPRCGDPVAAWSALGAVAAVVRLRDARRRAAVVVDRSGPASPVAAWLRATGLAPLELAPAAGDAVEDPLDVDTASLDVITRVHPGGCGAGDVDATLHSASWALRSGGVLVVTLPVGDDDPEWAVRPADVRGVLARADDLGLALVGDVDGTVTARMRRAAGVAAAAGGDAPAYGILRLTFRRR